MRFEIDLAKARTVAIVAAGVALFLITQGFVWMALGLLLPGVLVLLVEALCRR